jgi:CRISPR/Cas system-associated exonuclease Cas4 (RecB family)
MIADIIPKLAEFEREDWKYKPRPSNAGPERCIRQMVYHGLEVPKEPLPGRALLVFDDSSWHEELTADWIRKSAYKLHSEQMKVEIDSQGIKLTGHIDYLITDLTGQDFLLEHKAINHFSFQRYAEGDLPMDYLTQMALYLRGLQKIQPELKQGMLLVKNKNNAQYLEIECQYELDNLWVKSITTSTGEVKEIDKVFTDITENAFRKFVEINEYIKSKTLPKRQYELSDWRCQYCAWAGTCWQNWEQEIESMATDQALDEEFETLSGHYLELNMHITEMTKEKDELKNQIKNALKERNVRSGLAGKYAITLAVQNSKEYTVPAKSYEKLTIRLRKEAKNE